MSNLTPDVPKNDQKDVQNMVAMVDEYRNFEVTTVEALQHAADVLADAKSRCKQLEERRKKITQPLDDAKKSVMDLFRPATDALSALERIIKPKISAFQAKQEAERRKAQAEAEERARKERERLEKRAAAAAQKGQHEKAAALEEQAVTTVAAAPAVAETKVEGLSSRKKWKGRVTDLQKLCQAIADGKVPASVIDVKQAELDRFAATWQNSQKFDGIEIYQESIVASRSR